MDLRLVTAQESSADVNNPVEGDLYLDETGDVPWIDGAEAIAQDLRIRLRFFKGEWFLNTDEGVPYFQEVFEKGIAPRRLDSIFRQVILGTPGIASLNTFSLQVDSAARSLILDFEAVLDDGAVLSSESFGPFLVVLP